MTIEALRDALEEIAYMGLDCPAAYGPADMAWYRSRAYACIRVARLALDDLAETQRSSSEATDQMNKEQP